MLEIVDNDYKKVIKQILEFYYSKVTKNYIPAIINEGSLFSYDHFVNNDLYVKLIAVKKNTEINETWMIQNLSHVKRDDCFNFIVEYQYNRNNVYGIHPDLLCDSYVSICNQDNRMVLSLEYVDSKHKIKGDRILRSDGNNVLILSSLVKNYSDKIDYPFESDYDLYVEIEYRTFNDNLFPNRLGLFKTREGYFDISYEYNDSARKHDKEKLYWLRCTIKLDTNRLFDLDDGGLMDDFKVFDIETRTYRKLNPNNYDDDIHAGLIVFSKRAVTQIKKYYYFYDLTLIPKKENIKSSLVDIVGNYVVFWEGEFNSNIPHELKQSIKRYNIFDVDGNIISEPMYNSQLMGLWDIYKYLLPSQKLARNMRKYYKEKSFEFGLDFYPPQSIKEYSEFVKRILDVTKLDINSFNISFSNKEKLRDIINQSYVFYEKKDIYDDFQGLCYLLIKELGFNYDEDRT